MAVGVSTFSGISLGSAFAGAGFWSSSSSEKVSPFSSALVRGLELRSLVGYWSFLSSIVK